MLQLPLLIPVPFRRIARRNLHQVHQLPVVLDGVEEVPSGPHQLFLHALVLRMIPRHRDQVRRQRLAEFARQRCRRRTPPPAVPAASLPPPCSTAPPPPPPSRAPAAHPLPSAPPRAAVSRPPAPARPS